MKERIMCTVEYLPSGKVTLGVFKETGWIYHTFASKDELEKRYAKAALDWRMDVV